jgi:predicted nuclease with TOPRIM domain
MRLYEISSEFQKIVDLIENCDEMSPELIDQLNAVSENASAKVINVAAFIKNLEAEAKSMEDYIKNMQDRQGKIEKKIANLKDYLKYNMDILKLTKVESPELDVQLRANSFSLELFDQSAIPKEYIKVKETVSISKQDIIKDLKIGCDVPGARFVTTKSVLIK